MTYAEVKNQYTTIESVVARINEIEKANEEKENSFDSENKKYFNSMKEYMKTILPEWTLVTLDARHLTLNLDVDKFYQIEMWFGYEVVFDKNNFNKEEEWKFELSVSSTGSFPILDENSKPRKYYKACLLLLEEEIAKEIESKLKEYCNWYKSFHKSLNRSELMQLGILKKNLENEEKNNKILEAVKNAEDKTMVVIVNKNVDPAKSVGTHRNTPVTICSMPEPKDNWIDMNDRCKKMNKENKDAKYIATQIRLIKFN